MNIKRIVLIGGFVTMSLVADVPAASAQTDTAASAQASSAMDRRQLGSGQLRPTWLVRPRPAGQRASII
jgi:hypothetical protein